VSRWCALLLLGCGGRPEVPEAMPPDARLGAVLDRTWAGRAVARQQGVAPGGVVLGWELPEGWELSDGGFKQVGAASRWWWLADEADSGEAIEAPPVPLASALGVSLRARGAVAEALAEGFQRELAVLDGGAWQVWKLPIGVGPDDQPLVLGPDGRVLVRQGAAGWVCDAQGCAPAWDEVGRVPLAWGPAGVVMGWTEGAQVCAGVVGAAGPVGAPACAELPRFASDAARVLAPGWLDPDAVQVPVELGRPDLAAVQVYALQDGALVAGDVVPGSAVVAAPGGRRVHVVEADAALPEGFSPVPRWHTVEGGAFTGTDLEDFAPWLACACDRLSDPDCDCLPRGVAPSVLPTLGGAHARVIVEESFEAVHTLQAARLPLPQAVEPWHEGVCALPCPEARCDFGVGLEPTCEQFNAAFDPLFGRQSAGITILVEAAGPIADAEVTAVAVDPADAELYGAQFVFGEAASLIVPPDSTWAVRVDAPGYQPLVLPSVRAPGLFESVELGPYPLVPLAGTLGVYPIGADVAWSHPDALHVDAAGGVLFLVSEGRWRAVWFEAGAVRSLDLGLTPPATGSEPLRPVIAPSGEAVLATAQGAALVLPGSLEVVELPAGSAAWSASFSADLGRLVVRQPIADRVGAGPATVHALADGALVTTIAAAGAGESLDAAGARLARVEGEQAVMYELSTGSAVRQPLGRTLIGPRTRLSADGERAAVLGLSSGVASAGSCQAPGAACGLWILHADGALLDPASGAREVAWSSDGARLYTVPGEAPRAPGGLRSGVKRVDGATGEEAWVGDPLDDGEVVLAQSHRLLVGDGTRVLLADADADVVQTSNTPWFPTEAWSTGAIWYPGPCAASCSWTRLDPGAALGPAVLPVCDGWLGPDQAVCVVHDATGVSVDGVRALLGGAEAHPAASLSVGPLPCWPAATAGGLVCVR
jgi:hypothetical protein